MTDKELISKSRFINAAEIDDIRFLIDSGQITTGGAIRTIGQPPDYRYTAVISTHETPDFLLALLAEIAQTDLGLYAAARIYVGGAPPAAGHDTVDDQYDNNLGADFHSPDELADTLSITVFGAKRVIARIQQIAQELVLRDGWDPHTDTRVRVRVSQSPAS